MRKWFQVVLAGVMFISLSACSKEETAKKSISPLTGMEYRPTTDGTVMVMVNNASPARPQTGLNQADVVVEMLAEGEITRLAAFYHSQMTGRVGPVRSVRDYFYELAKGAHAIVVSAGGEKGALAEIQREEYPHLDGIHADERYFTRVAFRRAPHNLYTNFDQLKQALKDKSISNTSPAKYTFSSESATEKGQSAQKINLTYHRLYNCGYQYDSSNSSYGRYTQGVRQIDRETTESITMKNVIVVYAKHHMADQLGHRSIDITAGGKGYLFQNGKQIAIEWKFRDGLIIPLVEGNEVALLPGRTWVNVLPETGKVSFY